MKATHSKKISALSHCDYTTLESPYLFLETKEAHKDI